MNFYESRIYTAKNLASQVPDEETRRAIESIVELLEQMAKDLSEVKVRISTRTC